MLPNYLLEQWFFAGGQRLEKRHVFQDFEPPPKYGGYSSVYADRRLPSHYQPLDLGATSRADAGFKHHEYQFWREFRSQAYPMHQCRACYCTFATVEARRRHNETGCASQIVRALKVLRRQKLCLCCNAETGKTKWGAPLCSKKCIESWMFIGGQPSTRFDATIKCIKAEDEKARSEVR